MLLVQVPNLEVKAGISSFALGFGSLICGEVLIVSGEIGIHAAVVYPRFFPRFPKYRETSIKRTPSRDPKLTSYISL